MKIILQFNSKTELKTEDTNAARAALYVLHWKQQGNKEKNIPQGDERLGLSMYVSRVIRR